MIVDDTRDSSFILGKLLEVLGQQVRTADNGALALEMACREPPDVVISDIAMAGMDGYELARRVRQEPELAGVFLVALSGYGQASDQQRATEAGFDQYLIKPVSLEALEALFASLPARREPA